MPTHGQAGMNETSSCDVSGGPPSRTPGPFCHFTHLKSIFVLEVFSSPPPFYQSQAKLQRSRPGTRCLETDTAGTEEACASGSELLLQPTLCVSFPGVGKGNQSILCPDPATAWVGVSAALEVHQSKAKLCR